MTMKPKKWDFFDEALIIIALSIPAIAQIIKTITVPLFSERYVAYTFLFAVQMAQITFINAAIVLFFSSQRIARTIQIILLIIEFIYFWGYVSVP